MAIQAIDVLNEPKVTGRKRILFNSPNYHVWIHGETADRKAPNHMHKHTADETFYCLHGECVFHFADGSHRKVTPGTLVIIPAGDLYQIERVGDEYLSLLGTRAESDGMHRWDKEGNPSENDTEEGRRMAATRPPKDGRKKTAGQASARSGNVK